MPPRQSDSSGRAVLVVVVALLMFIAGAGAMYLWLRPAAAPPSPAPVAAVPSPVLEASPEVFVSPLAEAPPSTVAAAPVEVEPPVQTAAGPGKPPAAPPRGKKPDVRPAPDLEPVTPSEPAEPPPLGRPHTPAEPGARFAAGRTAVESLKRVSTEVEGFDLTGVAVKRVPAVNGRLDLEMSPSQVKPGEPYTVKVYLFNDGSKAILVDRMSVSMIVDGHPTSRPMPAKTKTIRPRERGLLEELPGVWKADVATWAVEVVVTSKDKDVYRNRLSWQ